MDDWKTTFFWEGQFSAAMFSLRECNIAPTRKKYSNVFVYDLDHELTNMLSLFGQRQMFFFAANDQRVVSWLLPEVWPGTRYAREFY